MIIQPKIRGFICTTAHPTGCEYNVKEQIDYVVSHPPKNNQAAPKRVLIIGSSSGYGLASRIVAAFGYQAATIGVFFEKPATQDKLGTAGWYNSAAFEKFAHQAGLYAKSFNGDAFSHAAKDQVIDTIKKDLGQVDLVIYSLAAPVRKHPDTGEVIRSSLKPVGKPYTAIAVDTNKDVLFEATIEPATPEEVDNTVKVMGGEDWRLWIDALDKAGVLAEKCETLAYSYIGTELTWPIYWEGALGAAKKDLDNTATVLAQQLSKKYQGNAHIAVLKSVVTQASSAIPVMPLYIAIVFKKMREAGLHEGCIEQILRLFTQKLYQNSNEPLILDEQHRLRLDDWELKPEIQEHCKNLWPTLTNETLRQLTDYDNYKTEFLKLFGFGVAGVDYTLDTSPEVPFNVINISE